MTARKDTAAILVCAGSAARMGGIQKILHPLGGTTVLYQVLRSFCRCESIAELLVICRRQDHADFINAVAAVRSELPCPVSVVDGGSERQESVLNGFRAITTDSAFVAIHDGARPLVQPAEIERVIAAARETGAATLAAPVKDTIKVVEDGIITATPERAKLWLAQTPQVFRRSLYAAALQKAQADGKTYTDDCQLVEALGVQVSVTVGSYANLKLTTPEDFILAEALLQAMQQKEE